MRNYVQEGRVLSIPATAAVKSGDVVVIGQIIGIAAGDAAAGGTVDVVTEGVFRLPKVAADAFTVGDAVCYDGATGLVTADDSNPKVGVAVEAAAVSTGTVAARLSGF